MQTLEVPREEQSASLWQLQGSVPAAPLSFFYRLGMAAVAFAMVLLPLVYIGLIACVAYATYRYAIDGLAMFEDRGGEKGKIMIYLGPLVIGGLVVLFMVKPLFARRQKRVDPTEIQRADAPQLFAFIDQICDLVRAPRPSRVAIDMQVNASASFRRGFFSLFGNDLTLTLGMPLVAGLTVRQFGGVLAHEFGHFAQGAGMRLTYVIRSINIWFARLVYERDGWDESLREAASKIDLRIGIVLHLARLMIWLTRKLLWVFMVAGHAISCFMLRQMEFDADYYETHVSGSDGFAQTAAKLPLLGAAFWTTDLVSAFSVQKQNLLAVFQVRRIGSNSAQPGRGLGRSRKGDEVCRTVHSFSCIRHLLGQTIPVLQTVSAFFLVPSPGGLG